MLIQYGITVLCSLRDDLMDKVSASQLRDMVKQNGT